MVGATRWTNRGAASAAHVRRTVVAVMVAGAALLWLAGCATFGRRGPVPEEVAACRELSRQGVAAMEMGHWQQAETLLQKAIDASPDDAEARRYMAEALWHRGAAEEALAQMADAVRLDPSDAALTVRAGEMSLAIGANDKALTQAERAIRSDPKLAAAWALRGRVFWQLRQPDRAMADLQRALELAPDSPDVLLDVAVIYRQRGQAARCLTTLRHLADTYPPGEEPQLATMLEGLTLLELGRPQQAAESLAAAARRGPPRAEAWYYLAQAESAIGRYAEATAAAQQALAIDASHQASRQLLAQLASRNDATEPQRR